MAQPEPGELTSHDLRPACAAGHPATARYAAGNPEHESWEKQKGETPQKSG